MATGVSETSPSQSAAGWLLASRFPCWNSLSFSVHEIRGKGPFYCARCGSVMIGAPFPEVPDPGVSSSESDFSEECPDPFTSPSMCALMFQILGREFQPLRGSAAMDFAERGT